MTLLKFRAIGALFLTCLVSGTHASDIDFAQSPLFISKSIDPNVMLLIDSSGSMNQLMWATGEGGYDPTVTYDNWGGGVEYEGKTYGSWTTDENNYFALEGVYCDDTGSVFDVSVGTGDSFNDLDDVYLLGNKKIDGQNNYACIKVPAPRNHFTRHTGNYLNYLFQTYADDERSINSPGNTVPSKTRGQTAISVAKTIVDRNPRLRFGVAKFTAEEGGEILSDCGASKADTLSAIDGIVMNGSTPLAEAYYETTRYFRGMESAYTNASYTSPIQYRCQRNFVIALTDGFPTYDTNFPAPTVASRDDDLPDFDGLSPTTTQSDFPASMPPYSDGFQPSGDESMEGYSLYLDDLALFAQGDLLDTNNTDLAGVSFNDPDNAVQNIVTYTVGLAFSTQMLADAAEAGDGLAFTADSEEQLLAALEKAVDDIQSRLGAGASVAANTTRVETGALVFQARFHSGDWSGELLARPITANGDLEEPAWNAVDEFPSHSNRNIFTKDMAAGVPVEFLWANLSDETKAILNTDIDGNSDSRGQRRLNLIRGLDVQINDNDASIFRARVSPLGDIINSDPEFVGHQNLGFSVLPGDEGSSYGAYIAAKDARTSMIYVGANDGMLHGFDAETGVEKLAYMPAEALPLAAKVIDIDYADNHLFSVDGLQRAVDTYWDSAWHTVLVGSMGVGGSSVFALDVSNPDSFAATDVLWEVNSATHSSLGISVPGPTIARLANGQWGAIVANGYNSAGGAASLLIFNAKTGDLIKEISTERGSTSDKNGLSSPIPIDIDGDRIADAVYAGDLHGNMWKFDISDSNINKWEVAYATKPNNGDPLPLFTACDGSSCSTANRQIITGRPEVAKNPDGGVVVFFGTGRYLAVGDNIVAANETRQDSFYAIYDNGDVVSGRDVLLEQSQLVEPIYIAESDQYVRVTTDYEVEQSHEGWFIDLPLPGERQVARPILRSGRIVFTTLIPSIDPCVAGGTSYIMELQALSGGRLEAESPFDINDDNEIDANDFIQIETEEGETITVAVSGVQSTVGIIKTPGVITAGDKEYKYASGTTGDIQKITESGGDNQGRLSWRQVR